MDHGYGAFTGFSVHRSGLSGQGRGLSYGFLCRIFFWESTGVLQSVGNKYLVKQTNKQTISSTGSEINPYASLLK